MAAARQSGLSVVGGKTTAKKTAAKRAARKPKRSVADAAANGTRREMLIATRDRIAKTVDNAKTPPRDLAALTRRLMDVANEIDAIDTAAEQEDRERQASPDEKWDESAI